MRTKTIFIVVFTVIITVFLMLNTDPVDFDFLVAQVPVSKLVVIGVCAALGFVIGYLVGRPKTVVSSLDPRFDDDDAPDSNSLSKEDRDYIS